MSAFERTLKQHIVSYRIVHVAPVQLAASGAVEVVAVDAVDCSLSSLLSLTDCMARMACRYNVSTSII